MTFSKAIFSLFIPIDTLPIFRVKIKHFHSLTPNSVLVVLLLSRLDKADAAPKPWMRKRYKGMEKSPQAFV
jgi:hypothetical protein